MIVLTSEYESPSGLIATARNVAVVGWRDAPTVEDLRAWGQIGRSLNRRFPGGAACIDLAVTGMPRFTEDMRAEAVSMTKDNTLFTLGVVHVVIVSGLTGSAVRAFINTVLLIAPPAIPVKVVGDIKSAAMWLAPKLTSHGWTSADLVSAATELHSKLVP